MKFVFVCPEKQKAFESALFEIINNKGISRDIKGNKVFNAQVRLSSPCPFCQKKHIYHASELSCPFNLGEQQVSKNKD